MRPSNIAIAAVVMACLSVVGGCGQHITGNPSFQSYEYGCLEISQVLANVQYFWHEPGRDAHAGRPPIPASADQMGAFFGLEAGQGNPHSIVGCLCRMGWRLVDVEREPP